MSGGWEASADAIGLAGVERLAFASEMSDVDRMEAALVDLMAELRDCPDECRHAELVAWCRSNLWHPALVLLTGWQGDIARAAWRSLRCDLDADTPGRRWASCDPAAGRESIVRLLGFTGNSTAAYATAPFRAWIDDDERPWIAGAVDSPPYLDADAAGRWLHLDISDVILWCPKSGETRLAGEHRSASTIVLPHSVDRTLTIWGDGGAFFRAWAAARARTAGLAMRRAAGEWAHPVVEPQDGGLPGGLLVGGIAAARWPTCTAETIVAGDGVTAAELHHLAAKTLMPRFAGVAR